MKNLKALYEELESRKDFKVNTSGFDGGTGVFINGNLKGATVIWSYAGGWEHVSICLKNRCPDWDEMCVVKNMFWGEDEAVIQLHPPKANYVNNMKNCLHLWKPIERYSGKIPLPPDVLVGIKELGVLE